MTTSEGRAETPEPDGTTLKPLDPNDPIDRVPSERLGASDQGGPPAGTPRRHPRRGPGPGPKVPGQARAHRLDLYRPGARPAVRRGLPLPGACRARARRRLCQRRVLRGRPGFFAPHADARRPARLLLDRVRRGLHRRHQDAGRHRRQDHPVLPLHHRRGRGRGPRRRDPYQPGQRGRHEVGRTCPGHRGRRRRALHSRHRAQHRAPEPHRRACQRGHAPHHLLCAVLRHRDRGFGQARRDGPPPVRAVQSRS